MKLDMMVVAGPTDHLKKVCDELRSLRMDVEHIADAYSAEAGLALHYFFASLPAIHAKKPSVFSCRTAFCVM